MSGLLGCRSRDHAKGALDSQVCVNKHKWILLERDALIFLHLFKDSLHKYKASLFSWCLVNIKLRLGSFVSKRSYRIPPETCRNRKGRIGMHSGILKYILEKKHRHQPSLTTSPESFWPGWTGWISRAKRVLAMCLTYLFITKFNS